MLSVKNKVYIQRLKLEFPGGTGPPDLTVIFFCMALGQWATSTCSRKHRKFGQIEHGVRTGVHVLVFLVSC